MCKQVLNCRLVSRSPLLFRLSPSFLKSSFLLLYARLERQTMSRMMLFIKLLSYWVGLWAQANFSTQTFKPAPQSPRWAMRCSFGSVSCSCDAAPGTAVRKRALPVASCSLSRQRRTSLIFAEQIEIFQAKAWLTTFTARNANPKFLDDRRRMKKKKKKQLDQPAEGIHARLRRSIVDLHSLGRFRFLSKSVVFGFFKFVVS